MLGTGICTVKFQLSWKWKAKLSKFAAEDWCDLVPPLPKRGSLNFRIADNMLGMCRHANPTPGMVRFLSLTCATNLHSFH